MEELRALVVWCQENNLSLNINKTKEGNSRGNTPPIYIDRTTVEKLENFKVLGTHITDKLNGPPRQTVW
jgi:hypothetical protein